MANTLLTIDMVTREALRVAHEQCQFIGTVDRQYDSSFANTGAKIGSALRVRRPNQYTRTQGSRVMDVQEQSEIATSITVATRDHVDMRFNSAELALSIDEMSKRYIEPAVKVLVSGIESDFIAYATKATYNTAGTAGTPPTDLVAVGAARAKLNQYLAPKDGNRYVQMDSVTMGGMVNGLKGLFQDSTQIKEQYREGMIGRTAMADWYENERLWTMTMGSDVDSVTINDADRAAKYMAGTDGPQRYGTAQLLQASIDSGLPMCFPEWSPRFEATVGCPVADICMDSFDAFLTANASRIICDCVYHPNTLIKTAYAGPGSGGGAAWSRSVDIYKTKWSGSKAPPP